MKQTCPNCHTLVEIDESIYTNSDVVKVECPVCGEDLEFYLCKEQSAETKEEKEQCAPVKTDVHKEEGVQKEDSNVKGTGINKPATSTSAPSTETNKKKSLIAFLSILCVIGLVCLYAFVYRPYKIDKDAPRLYVYADNLNVRSSMVGEVEYNIIDKAHYGSELIVYENKGEWTYIKYNKKKGYVSRSFLMSKRDFDLLNNMWGNSDARETIVSGKCRKAMVDYYHRENIFATSIGWQYFSQGKKAKPNTVFYPRIYNQYSRFTDFCFVLKNNSHGESRLVVYSFDDDTEEPIFRGMYDITYCGSNLIKNICLDKKQPNVFVVEYADQSKYRYEK